MYEIVRVLEHFEVVDNMGNFIFSADSYKEVEESILLLPI